MNKIFNPVFLALLIISCQSGDFENAVKEEIKAYSLQQTEPMITAFSILGSAGTINNKDYSISVKVPYGTNLTSLVAEFSTTGISSIKVNKSIQKSGVTVNDFINPVKYSLTTVSGKIIEYTVTTSTELNSEKVFTIFSIAQPYMLAAVDEANKKITAVLPYGTDLKNLTANFAYAGKAVKIGNIPQISGISANDFSNEIIYSVYADDGSSVNYSASIKAAPSSAKEITSFSILGRNGVIDENAKTITVNVPFWADVSALTPTFSTTGKTVSVGGVEQVSGINTNDFTEQVKYTIIAENGATVNYSVSVTDYGIVTTIAEGLLYPYGIATDGLVLYITTAEDNITKIDLSSNEKSVFIGGFGYSTGLVIENNTLFITDLFNDAVKKIDIETATITDNYSGFWAPQGITVYQNKTYIADGFNNEIKLIDNDSGLVTIFAGLSGSDVYYQDGTGQDARFNYPCGITTDGTNLYIADTFNSIIRKISIASKEVTTFAGKDGVMGITDGYGHSARFANPSGLTTDGTNIYVADTENHSIRKISIKSGIVTTIAGGSGYGLSNGTGSSARFYGPVSLIINSNTLYVTDTNNKVIRKIH